MSSFTLTLSAPSSDLSANYFPPIELSPNEEYVCGLIDFQSFMSIPNVTKQNNRLYFGENFILKLNANSYYTASDIREQLIKQIKHFQQRNFRNPTIEDFQKKLRNIIAENNNVSDNTELDSKKNGDEDENVFNANKIEKVGKRKKTISGNESDPYLKFKSDTFISYPIAWIDFFRRPITSIFVKSVKNK